MDVTESNAAQTIQDLEMRVSKLNNKISEISYLLSKKDIDAATLISTASNIISAT